MSIGDKTPNLDTRSMESAFFVSEAELSGSEPVDRVRFFANMRLVFARKLLDFEIQGWTVLDTEMYAALRKKIDGTYKTCCSVVGDEFQDAARTMYSLLHNVATSYVESVCRSSIRSMYRLDNAIDRVESEMELMRDPPTGVYTMRGRDEDCIRVSEMLKTPEASLVKLQAQHKEYAKLREDLNCQFDRWLTKTSDICAMSQVDALHAYVEGPFGPAQRSYVRMRV